MSKKKKKSTAQPDEVPEIEAAPEMESAPEVTPASEVEAEPAESAEVIVDAEIILPEASEEVPPAEAPAPEPTDRKKKRKKAKSSEPIPVAEGEAIPEGESSPEVTPVSEVSEESPETTPTEGEITETPLADEENPTEGEPASEEEAEPEVALGWELSQVVEAILFASQKPVSVKELQSVLKGAAEADKENPFVTQFAKVKPDQLRDAIEILEIHTSDPKRAYEVRESAAGWQLVTKPDYAPWLRQLFPENRPARLSAPALETLAIIAYRQPITRADLEAVRGVAVDGVMQTLMDRALVKIAGRADIPGRPLLYETTQNFMEHFGLKNLDDLPNATELRKIQLPKAPVPEPPAAKEKKAAPAEPAPTPAPELFDSAPANEEPDAPAPQPSEEPDAPTSQPNDVPNSQ